MDFDVIVIGGGVNGCGIARDAAMRGFKTLLLEKNDFGSGTTGASSQMIHGGARYLLSSLKTTRSSSVDSGYIQKIAPHLLFRIPFLFPVLKKPGKGQWMSKIYLELLDTYFQAYDKYSALKNGLPHTRLSAEEARQLEPDLAENLLGAISFDEWGIDSFRLCLSNVLSAQQHGAELRNHFEVKRLMKRENRVTGVMGVDTLTGAEHRFNAKIVVNVAGPWSPRLAEMAGCEVPLRPAKGIHVAFDRRLSHYAVMASAIDGRSIFLMPYQNIAVMGTTDDDFFGDPDHIPILEDEVDYLTDGIAQVFPAIRGARMIRSWAGVRPTLAARGPYEDDLSRDHLIFDHETIEGVAGFVSMAGGKLASYRLMSEDLVDVLCRKLGVEAACRTHLVPLPGGEKNISAEDLAGAFSIPVFAAQRLVYRYGARAEEMLKAGRDEGILPNIICQCDPVLETELRYVVRHEWARTLEDLQRRTSFSAGPCQGTRCFLMGAQILGEELKLSPSEVRRHTREILQSRFEQKLPILKGTSLQQEELCASTYYKLGGLDT